MILVDNRTTRMQNKLKNDDVNELIRLVLQKGTREQQLELFAVWEALPPSKPSP